MSVLADGAVAAGFGGCRGKEEGAPECPPVLVFEVNVLAVVNLSAPDEESALRFPVGAPKEPKF